MESNPAHNPFLRTSNKVQLRRSSTILSEQCLRTKHQFADWASVEGFEFRTASAESGNWLFGSSEKRLCTLEWKGKDYEDGDPWAIPDILGARWASSVVLEHCTGDRVKHLCGQTVARQLVTLSPVSHSSLTPYNPPSPHIWLISRLSDYAWAWIHHNSVSTH